MEEEDLLQKAVNLLVEVMPMALEYIGQLDEDYLRWNDSFNEILHSVHLMKDET